MSINRFVFLILLLTSTNVNAQFSDSLSIVAGSLFSIASKNIQPLWLIANQYSTITNQQTDLATHIRVSNCHLLTGKSTMVSNNKFRKNLAYYLNYGIDVYNNQQFQKVFFQEAFFLAGYKNWQIRGGRYERRTGDTDSLLSSGSFGISGNALPIPMIEITVINYTPVPFTNRWLQFKGGYSHGWLGNTNYVKGAYLHEKTFYLKIGKERISFYGGLNHFAQWGGMHPAGPAPSRFKDYLKIILGAKGNGSDPVYLQGPIDIINAVGNHLIIPDFGGTFRLKQTVLKLYTQTIFEKGRGRGPYERDKLVGLKILSRDRLVGLSWQRNKSSILEKIVVEGIYTKHQGGPVLYQGRDNYYNNSTYLSGWTYQDNIIGTPLFMSRKNAVYYNQQGALNNLSGWSVESNRIKALHVGLKGHISDRLQYRTLATYVQHYGNYYNDAAFTPSKRQNHVLIQSSYRLTKNFTLTAAIGRDFGDLVDVTGGSFNFECQLR